MAKEKKSDLTSSEMSLLNAHHELEVVKNEFFLFSKREISSNEKKSENPQTQ